MPRPVRVPHPKADHPTPVVVLGDPTRQAGRLNVPAWVHLVPQDDPETALRYTTQAIDLATLSGDTHHLLVPSAVRSMVMA